MIATAAIGDSMLVMGEEKSRASSQPERGPRRFIIAWERSFTSQLDFHLERVAGHIGQLNGRGTVHHTLLPVIIIITIKINMHPQQSVTSRSREFPFPGIVLFF